MDVSVPTWGRIALDSNVILAACYPAVAEASHEEAVGFRTLLLEKDHPTAIPPSVLDEVEQRTTVAIHGLQDAARMAIKDLSNGLGADSTDGDALETLFSRLYATGKVRPEILRILEGKLLS